MLSTGKYIQDGFDKLLEATHKIRVAQISDGEHEEMSLTYVRDVNLVLTPAPVSAPVPAVEYPATTCATNYADPYGSGSLVDCCYGTVSCLNEWSPSYWHYLCVPCSESGQCANPGDFTAMCPDANPVPTPAPVPDCYEELGVMGSCTQDADCCSNDCSNGNPSQRFCQSQMY